MNTGQEFKRWHRIMQEDEPEIARGIRTTKIVCPCCEGTGTTWHGWHSDEACTFSQDEWMELDYDDRMGYMEGRYDKTCPECNGQNVIDVLDETYSSSEAVESWNDWRQDAYESAAVARMERAMGA